MIELAHELDRYHGFAQAQIPAPARRRQLTSSTPEDETDAKFSASQGIETA